ncbi:MAG: ribosome silencing factor [Anaerolineales bacterium]|nr:ribosome silencing factor [Anaerolineales bacterium]
MDTLELARTLVTFLEEKKGEDIILLDIHDISDFADYFVICSGTSDRMLQALADDLSEKARQQMNLRGRLEGVPQDGWMLLDYGDVIIHLFSPDRRDYYRLEELWSKGKVLLRLQ